MNLAALPPHTRVWIYQSNRNFTNEETQWLHAVCKEFVENWSSHGKDLASGYDIRYDRFLILAVDESAAGASGCSIDKSVHLIRQIEQQLGISLTARTQITYLNEAGKVESFELNDLKDLLAENKISTSTRFFNNLVATKADLDDHWLTPIAGSWMERFA